MQSEYGAWLRDQLSLKGWTQGDLARRIGTSQPAVSQMVAGKRAPSAKVQRDIARVLDVTPPWAATGSAGSETTAMTDASGDLTWHEREAYPDGTQSFGNTRVEALKTTLQIFARETAQNSNDAALSGEVSMEYRLSVLSGERLREFLAAIAWSTLLPHYEAVARDLEHRTSKRYRDGLNLFESSGKLWTLRVDDYGTSGLTGEEFGDGCFSALVRRSQDTRKKQGAAAGGRFGLGAGMLSALSALDLVFFSSNLASPVYNRTQGRLIGRAYFPFHRLQNGKEFEGPFFYGIPDTQEPVRRLSAWATPQQLSRLALSRRDDGTLSGSSILIVGFFDPQQGIDADADPAIALQTLNEAFVENFWPAIANAQLSASFSLYDNDRLISEQAVDSSQLSHPYAKLLTDKGDIQERRVMLQVPKTKSSGDGPFDHSARLLIEVLPAEAIGAKQVNKVALCRRPMMVVKYLNLPHLTLGARPFRAVLLAGEAAASNGAPSNADIAAELFLSKCEPAQHDDWTSIGTDLVSEYIRPTRPLDEFMANIKKEIKELVSPEGAVDDEAPRELRELLSLPGTTAAPILRAYVHSLEWQDPGDYKRLAATVRLSTKSQDDVAFAPLLTVTTETGSGLALDAEIVSYADASVTSDGSIRPKPNVREFKFVLEPLWHETPVRPSLSALNLDMGIVEKARA